AIAAAAALGVAFAGTPRAATAPLAVAASLEPASVHYGDPVSARIEVHYDPAAVDPSTIRGRPNLTAYAVTSGPVPARPRAGVLALTYSLLCVTEGCLPTKGPRLLRFSPVIVTGATGTGTLRATAAWPSLRVSSRLTASDLAGKVRFRSPSRPPAPAYRVSPGGLSAALIAAAAVCGLVAVVLVLRELVRHRRRSHARVPSRLELAIVYVRDSTRRSDADRRRALSFLSEAVEGGETDLAAVAADTAWAKTPPTPPNAAAPADRAARVPQDAR